MSEHSTLRPPKHSDSQTVTVLAPTPQDAKYCEQVLCEHSVSVELVNSIYDVTTRIRAGAGVVLIAQVFLTAESTEHLRSALNEQASWSDVPLLVLLAQGEASPQVITELLSIGHVTLIQRPLRIALLVSTLKAKLRDRARQYEVRDLLLKAQLANASKSEFLANMSHEIRTPMTSILGYAEIMTDLIDNQEALGYLATIRRNGAFLLGIINDILDLSKIEAGKVDIDIERFDPVRVIVDVRNVMEVRARENELNLELEIQYPDAPHFVESDAKRLKQILINLVGNAIKFTKQGGVKIVVDFPEIASSKSQLADAPSRQLRIAIIDSGIGMTPEQQERLFKPFSQGDSRITQQFGGTGLGLAISQRLAAMLGGKIEVASKINEGTTFTLTLANGGFSTGPSPLPPEPQSIDSLASSEEIQLNAHILIVDDRRDIRYLSKHIVTQAGGRVTEADDGIQAVETVKRSIAQGVVFDLILLDMQMPNMDGYESAKQLRQLGYQGPIIALTADAMHGDMTRCLEAGCNDYLSKPIDKARMLQKIVAFIKNSEEQ
jgi:two-component system, chemotaxis family, CheB/CheR fusion protein